MNKTVIIVLLIFLCGCKQELEKKSLYLTFNGTKHFSTTNIVLINHPDSFIDSSLMEVGRPDEILISNSDFTSLINKLDDASYSINAKSQVGIFLLEYSNQECNKFFSFKNADEIEKLNNIISESISDNDKRIKVLNWIEDIEKFL